MNDPTPNEETKREDDGPCHSIRCGIHYSRPCDCAAKETT